MSPVQSMEKVNSELYRNALKIILRAKSEIETNRSENIEAYIDVGSNLKSSVVPAYFPEEAEVRKKNLKYCGRIKKSYNNQQMSEEQRACEK